MGKATLFAALFTVGCGAASPVGPTESSTIDALIRDLRAHGASVVIGEVLPQRSSPFFSTNAQLLIVNGGNVSVFQYASIAAAESDAAKVSRDGSSVGSTMITWVGPPHFYKSGQLIVLHAGNSQAVLDRWKRYWVRRLLRRCGQPWRRCALSFSAPRPDAPICRRRPRHA